MSDTELTPKTNGEKDSSVFGVSIRAWLAIILSGAVAFTHCCITIAVCWDAISKSDFSKVGTFSTIGEPLYSMAVMAVAFYFGTKQQTKP